MEKVGECKFWKDKGAKDLSMKGAKDLSMKDSKHSFLKMKSSKKGQGGLIGGILLVVIAVIIFMALTPAMDSIIDGPRGCLYFNCEGYIDNDASAANCSVQNQTYVSDQETKDIACIATDIFLPVLILAILAGFVTLVVSGRLGRQEEQYGGAY